MQPVYSTLPAIRSLKKKVSTEIEFVKKWCETTDTKEIILFVRPTVEEFGFSAPDPSLKKTHGQICASLIWGLLGVIYKVKKGDGQGFRVEDDDCSVSLFHSGEYVKGIPIYFFAFKMKEDIVITSPLKPTECDSDPQSS